MQNCEAAAVEQESLFGARNKTGNCSDVAQRLKAEYPGCPAKEAEAIAAHCLPEKHSGRVGRSAAAKELDPKALRLAVIAHIRHQHTAYDQLLGRYGDRQPCRAEVREKIDEILEEWERPSVAKGCCNSHFSLETHDREAGMNPALQGARRSRKSPKRRTSGREPKSTQTLSAPRAGFA